MKIFGAVTRREKKARRKFSAFDRRFSFTRRHNENLSDKIRSNEKRSSNEFCSTKKFCSTENEKAETKISRQNFASCFLTVSKSKPSKTIETGGVVLTAPSDRKKNGKFFSAFAENKKNSTNRLRKWNWKRSEPSEWRVRAFYFSVKRKEERRWAFVQRLYLFNGICFCWRWPVDERVERWWFICSIAARDVFSSSRTRREIVPHWICPQSIWHSRDGYLIATFFFSSTEQIVRETSYVRWTKQRYTHVQHISSSDETQPLINCD